MISSGGLSGPTQVQNVSPSAGIEPQRGIASWTILRIEFFNVFVETGLVGDMAAGKLQDSLSPEGVFQRFLTDGALTPDKRSFPPGARALELEHARHRTT